MYGNRALVSADAQDVLADGECISAGRGDDGGEDANGRVSDAALVDTDAVYHVRDLN